MIQLSYPEVVNPNFKEEYFSLVDQKQDFLKEILEQVSDTVFFDILWKIQGCLAQVGEFYPWFSLESLKGDASVCTEKDFILLTERWKEYFNIEYTIDEKPKHWKITFKAK